MENVLEQLEEPQRRNHARVRINNRREKSYFRLKKYDHEWSVVKKHF
jgi:hypothetical protein